jgi:hypothetical protein
MAHEFKTYIPVAISNPKLNTPQAIYAAQDNQPQRIHPRLND